MKSQLFQTLADRASCSQHATPGALWSADGLPPLSRRQLAAVFRGSAAVLPVWVTGVQHRRSRLFSGELHAGGGGRATQSDRRASPAGESGGKPSPLPSSASILGCGGLASKQKIPLGHGEDVGGIAAKFAAVGLDGVSVGIDFDFGEVVVPEHVAFGDVAAGVDRAEGFAEARRAGVVISGGADAS